MKKYFYALIFVLNIYHGTALAQFSPAELYANGLKRFYNAEFKDGIKYFTDYIKTRPSDFNGYMYRGLCYQAMKNYHRSIEDFSRQIDLTRNFSDGYVNRGNSFYFNKNLPSALMDYKDAVRVDPKSFEGYTGQSRVYFMQRKFDQALKAINLAQGVDPVNPRSYINKVMVHLQQNLPSKIFEDVLSSMYYDSNIVFTDYRRDLLYVKIEYYKSTLDFINYFMQMNPNNYIYYFVRGFFYLLTNKYQNSLDDLKKAVQLNNDPDPLFNNATNIMFRSINRNF